MGTGAWQEEGKGKVSPDQSVAVAQLVDHVFELEAEGVAHVVAPSAPVELALMEEDGTKLLELYVDGRRMAAALLQSLGWEGNPTFH